MAATPSGKDKTLRWARIYVGEFNLSGDALTFSRFRNELAYAPQMGWSGTVRNFISANMREVGLEGFQAYMNDIAEQAFTILKSSPNTDQLSLLFGGGGEPAVPDPCVILPSMQINDRTQFTDNLGVISADFIYDASQYDAQSDYPIGVVLQPETSYGATQTNASHDNEAGTTNGWHANIHITASDAGEWAYVIEDSANDADWATLGTFVADGSAVLSEHLSGSGTVDQFTRMVSTKVSGTTTAVVTFCRNP